MGSIPARTGPLFVVGDPATHNIPDTLRTEGLSAAAAQAARNAYLFNRRFLHNAYFSVENHGEPPVLIPIHTQIVFRAVPQIAQLYNVDSNTHSANMGVVGICNFRVRVVLSVLRWIYTGQLVYMPDDWIGIQNLALILGIRVQLRNMQGVDECVRTLNLTIHDVEELLHPERD